MSGSGTDPSIDNENEAGGNATPPVGEGPLGRWSMIWLGLALLICVVLAVGWTLTR